MKRRSSARPFVLRLPTRRISPHLIARLGEVLIVTSLIAAVFFGFWPAIILLTAGLISVALEPQSPVSTLLEKISKFLSSSPLTRFTKKRE